MPAFLLMFLPYIERVVLVAAVLGGTFGYGAWEGRKWTQAAEAARYEIARQAEVVHQNQVEAEFKTKEQALIDQDRILTDQISEIQNAASNEPSHAVVCLTPDGVRRLNQIR